MALFWLNSEIATDDNEFTRILQWPGYRVYRQKIDEKNKILELSTETGSNKLGQTFGTPRQSSTRPASRLWIEGHILVAEDRPRSASPS
jgi:hypothetical protein